MLKTDGVLWHITASLDGYVADEEGRVDFLAGYGGRNPLASTVVQSVGAILTGRGSFDVGERQGGAAYGGKITVPTFVVSRRPAPANADPQLMFLSGNDLAAAVTTAKRAAQGKMVVIIGPTLAAAMFREGLVDQVLIHLVPVLLGKGMPLFGKDAEPLAFKVIDASQAGQVTNLILTR